MTEMMTLHDAAVLSVPVTGFDEGEWRHSCCGEVITHTDPDKPPAEKGWNGLYKLPCPNCFDVVAFNVQSVANYKIAQFAGGEWTQFERYNLSSHYGLAVIKPFEHLKRLVQSGYPFNRTWWLRSQTFSGDVEIKLEPLTKLVWSLESLRRTELDLNSLLYDLSAGNYYSNRKEYEILGFCFSTDSLEMMVRYTQHDNASGSTVTRSNRAARLEFVRPFSEFFAYLDEGRFRFVKVRS